MKPIISVSGLSFTYGGSERPAVRDLAFDVARGEIFGFLGPSGAGKSTVQKILIRLLTGFQGSVSVRGRPVQDWDARFYEDVGVAFEYPTHFNKLSARENLRYFGALFSNPTLPPEELLASVGLASDADKPVGEFSKGMKTRLSVARALLNDPELIFLDEPTGGLDPVNARTVKELIREQTRGRRKTVFLTTHDMSVADQLCDRVAFIIDGRIKVIDSPRTLKLNHGERTVRVEYRSDGKLEFSEFPLESVGENREFAELLRTADIETIHTQEASLDDVFVKVTGRELR
ncbi:MAG: ABC transporter ATP-binding protein [Xanthomonadales bacterium]|nr:ABC transporter ATP-binding protein [Xanthomonadales bacterium]